MRQVLNGEQLKKEGRKAGRTETRGREEGEQEPGHKEGGGREHKEGGKR